MVILLLFSIVGIGFLIAGYLADPSAVTSDGYSLKSFFYIMGGGFLIPLLLATGFSLAGATKRKKVEDLLATGQQGETVVLSLEDTGTLINHDPRVRMLLEIRISGHSPYQVRRW